MELIPQDKLRALAAASVRKAITFQPMGVVQIAALVKRPKSMDLAQLSRVLNESRELEASKYRSGHWSYDTHRALAIAQALHSVKQPGFAEAWDAWREAA